MRWKKSAPHQKKVDVNCKLHEKPISFVGNKTIDGQLVVGEPVECFVLQLEMPKNAAEVTCLRQRKTRRSWCWFFELCFEFISHLQKTIKQHLSRMLLKRTLQNKNPDVFCFEPWLNIWRYRDFTTTTQEYPIPKLIPSWWFQPIWKISISQIGSFHQVGVKINNMWNHHRFIITTPQQTVPGAKKRKKNINGENRVPRRASSMVKSFMRLQCLFKQSTTSKLNGAAGSSPSSRKNSSLVLERCFFGKKPQPKKHTQTPTLHKGVS